MSLFSMQALNGLQRFFTGSNNFVYMKKCLIYVIIKCLRNNKTVYIPEVFPATLGKTQKAEAL